MKIIAFLIVIFLLTSTIVLLIQYTEAQTSLLWNRDYSMTGSGICVVSTQDGGYAIAGTSKNQFILIKTNSLGELQWNKTYGEGIANSIVQTSDGGYALAGTGVNFNFVKTDVSGNLQSKKNYNNSGVSFLIRSVIQAADGGYAMAGWTPAGSSPSWDWTIKTDSQGTIVWNRTYGVTLAQSQATRILQEDNGFVLAANGNLYRLNQNGEVQWSTPAVITNGLIKTFDAGYLIAAGDSATLIKKDHEGNTQWSKSYRYQGAQYGNFFHSVTSAKDGGYVMSGTTYPRNIGLAWILKVDSNGTFVGEITIAPESGINNRALSILEASDESFVFTGSKNAPDGEGNVWLAKVPSGAIPELPSCAFLPIFIITTLLMVLIHWKKHRVENV